MVYLCLCGLAKMLQILNQQENYFLPHGLQQAILTKEWNAKLGFCFLMDDKKSNTDIFFWLIGGTSPVNAAIS
jgi:hypothetical protein